MISFLLANIIPIAIAIGGAIFTGMIYGKGRKHAKAEADRELHEALDRHERDIEAAIRHGDLGDSGELRDDDGFRRDG